MSFTIETTIRPGLLVAVKTSIKGNVTYKKTVAEVHKLDDGIEVSEWETEKRIKNAVEQEAAAKARNKARNLVSGICSVTDFAYLCPVAAKPELDKALEQARKVCDEFNATSTVTKLRFNVITGTIAQNDYSAVRAVRREITELLTDMQDGLKNLDAAGVRESASRLKQMGQMLSPEAEVRVELAIKQVRETAKKIATAAKEGVAVEIDNVTIQRLQETRTMFLDLDGTDEVAQPVHTAPVLDLVGAL